MNNKIYLQWIDWLDKHYPESKEEIIALFNKTEIESISTKKEIFDWCVYLQNMGNKNTLEHTLKIIMEFANRGISPSIVDRALSASIVARIAKRELLINLKK